MSKKYVRMLPLVLTIILLMTLQVPAAFASKMEVHSWNGFPVAVKDYRYEPGTVIGEIEPGEIVDVRAYVGDKGEWAEIKYGNSFAYIKTQYLKEAYPTILEFNDEEQGDWELYYPQENPLQNVAPNPKRITGIVYLRYTPEKDGVIAKRMKINCVMTVLAEMGNWLQVREEISGIVGFVRVDEVVPIEVTEQQIRLLQDSYD